MPIRTRRKTLIAVSPNKIRHAQKALTAFARVERWRSKLQCAQKLLGAKTAEETIERALDVVIAKHEQLGIAHTANGSFLKSRNPNLDTFLQAMAAGSGQAPILPPAANERAFYYEDEA